MAATVVAVSRSAKHTLGKGNQEAIQLLEGLGVEGDAHAGVTVKHRYDARYNPTKPNLRQVHLIDTELHNELREQGFNLTPGQMGENITTEGIDLLNLPTGTRLRFGESATIEITGLRTPCSQLEHIQPGLLKAVISKDEQGNTIRRCGIMAIVLSGGPVNVGDIIIIELPAAPHQPLGPV